MQGKGGSPESRASLTRAKRELETNSSCFLTHWCALAGLSRLFKKTKTKPICPWGGPCKSLALWLGAAQLAHSAMPQGSLGATGETGTVLQGGGEPLPGCRGHSVRSCMALRSWPALAYKTCCCLFYRIEQNLVQYLKLPDGGKAAAELGKGLS